MSSYFDNYEKIKHLYKRFKPGAKFKHKFAQNIIITIKSIEWVNRSGIVIYEYDSDNTEDWLSLGLFIYRFELYQERGLHNELL